VTAAGTIHQIKVTLREVHPPVWRRVHLPSAATMDQLHEVVQVAMGWEQHHPHLFGKSDAEYGDNARDETKVPLAALIPRAGDWLGYRYDFGDMFSAARRGTRPSHPEPPRTRPRSPRQRLARRSRRTPGLPRCRHRQLNSLKRTPTDGRPELVDLGMPLFTDRAPSPPEG
jgi:hypothetical protein